MRAKCVARSGAVARSIVFLVASLALFSFEVLAEGPMACAGYLNTAEVQSALGMKLEAVEPVEYSEGFTVCSWVIDRPEGQLGVNLSFFELKAIREGMISAESIPEFFDLQVSSKRDELGTEPAKLEKTGKQAALFYEDILWTAMIELEKGFAHLSISPATDVPRAKVEKLAKAVGSRGQK